MTTQATATATKAAPAPSTKPGMAEATEQQKRWSSGAPRLITPTNGPGYTPRKWAEGNVVHGTATPKQPTTDCTKADYPKYLGDELLPNPGLTADRFAAFDLPSLVNGVRVQPKRITAMCMGAAGPVEAFGGAQRRTTGIAFDPAMLHADYIAGRCIEVGDCWEWQGAVSSGGPMFGRQGTANISVRRLIVDHRGQHRSRRQVVTTTCNNPRCVNPAHVVVRPKGYAIARAAATTGAWQNPARRQRIANWARATKGVLTPEQAAEIRLAPGTQVAIAKQYGVAKQTVWQIKSGATWVDHHNPFAGLMRGAQ